MEERRLWQILSKTNHNINNQLIDETHKDYKLFLLKRNISTSTSKKWSASNEAIMAPNRPNSQVLLKNPPKNLPIKEFSTDEVHKRSPPVYYFWESVLVSIK